MTKIKIHYINSSTTVITNDSYNFEEYCSEIFKAPIFICISANTPSVAVNTRNIIFIEEVEE